MSGIYRIAGSHLTAYIGNLYFHAVHPAGAVVDDGDPGVMEQNATILCM
jgi:hypothetical protein